MKRLPSNPDPEGDASSAGRCPLTAALNAIGGKWSLICLYWLDEAPRRFNELHRLMPDISHKMLSATLRNLELEGLVTRTRVGDGAPRVRYETSPHGQSVRPLIEAVRRWGHAHLDRRSEPPRPTGRIKRDDMS